MFLTEESLEQTPTGSLVLRSCGPWGKGQGI